MSGLIDEMIEHFNQLKAISTDTIEMVGESNYMLLASKLKEVQKYDSYIKCLANVANSRPGVDSCTLPEFNSTKIIELAESNKDKCKNYKFDWRSYYNGFLDGFATYFNKQRNCH